LVPRLSLQGSEPQGLHTDHKNIQKRFEKFSNS
jgi:hypothetical protein